MRSSAPIAAEILRFATFAVGAALLAAPAQAATVLPLSIGGVTFSNFRGADPPRHIDAGCNGAFFALGSASCRGDVFYANGPLGPGIHVTGAVLGTGTTTAGPEGANPIATAALTMDGGDEFSGAGGGTVTTQLQYYVAIVPLGPIPTTGLKIPLIFVDAGSITGAGSSKDEVEGEAETQVHKFNGNILFDGFGGSIGDQVIDGETGSLSRSYAMTHSAVFDFSEGDAVAEVDLLASCGYLSLSAGFGSANCNASADPFFGFDQAAFDARMGSHTFNLSDAFRIEVSPGLEPPVGVPEPAAWTLMVAGFGLAGVTLRRRLQAA
jgi:hypothetical protein